LPSSYKIEKLTEAAQPAVSVCDLKDQIGLDSSAYDDLIEAYELSARSLIEQQTGRILAESDFVVYLDMFPDCDFYFSNGPVSSITSIEYLVDGVWTEVSSAIYLLGRGSLLSQRVVRVDGAEWPTDKDSQNESVRINYTAGGDDVRGNQALRLLVAHWFANREASIVGAAVAELPMGVKALMNNLKNYTVK
jgi:uncharacterized phiE125 gp8 family phage protein